MSQRTGHGYELILRFLVAYRLLFYLGGLIAMSVPLGLAWTADVHLPPAARTSIVGVSMGLILATYLAERRVGLDHIDPRTGESAERYSLRLRASVGLGILGVAVGLYFLFSGRPAAGALFVVGAVLFFGTAYRAESEGDARGA